MVFRKKKKEEPQLIRKAEPKTIEVDEEDFEDSQEINNPLSLRPPQPPKPKPTTNVGKVRIIEGIVLDNGIFKYTVLSTKSLGEIGEEFPVD